MMKHVLFTGLCILFIVQVTGDYMGDWSQFGNNPQHTFFSGASVSKNLEIEWQYQFESSNKQNSDEFFCSLSSPAVVNNVVYVPTHHSMYCLDIHSGKLLQEVPAYTIYPYTPTVADGRVYLAAQPDLFRCVDTITGKTMWEKEIPDMNMVNPLIDDNTVYVTVDQLFPDTFINPCFWIASEWSTLLAIDKETGKEIWHLSLIEDPFDTGGVMRGVGFPILVDDTIFFYAQWYRSEKSYSVYSNKSGLIALDACTGAFKWICEGILPSSSMSGVNNLAPLCLTYDTGRIYIGTLSYVVCIDIETQELLWEYEDVPMWAMLSVGNGVVVVCSWTRVDCLDVETGGILWKIPIGGDSMPVMTEHEVFIGAGDENLYRVDIKTGKILESYYLGEAVYSPVIADDHIFVTTGNNIVYCLGPSTSYFTTGILTIIAVGAGLLLLLKKGIFKRHVVE